MGRRDSDFLLDNEGIQRQKSFPQKGLLRTCKVEQEPPECCRVLGKRLDYQRRGLGLHCLLSDQPELFHYGTGHHCLPPGLRADSGPKRSDKLTHHRKETSERMVSSWPDMLSPLQHLFYLDAHSVSLPSTPLCSLASTYHHDEHPYPVSHPYPLVLKGFPTRLLPVPLACPSSFICLDALDHTENNLP